MNVHKDFEYLENLDVSSEYDLSDDKYIFLRGIFVILPPNDEGNCETDPKQFKQKSTFSWYYCWS